MMAHAHRDFPKRTCEGELFVVRLVNAPDLPGTWVHCPVCLVTGELLGAETASTRTQANSMSKASTSVPRERSQAERLAIARDRLAGAKIRHGTVRGFDLGCDCAECEAAVSLDV